MAEEFHAHNPESIKEAFLKAFGDVSVTFEPHTAVFKPRVPGAVGIIRTGDTIQYANMVIVSG